MEYFKEPLVFKRVFLLLPNRKGNLCDQEVVSHINIVKGRSHINIMEGAACIPNGEMKKYFTSLQSSFCPSLVLFLSLLVFSLSLHKYNPTSPRLGLKLFRFVFFQHLNLIQHIYTGSPRILFFVYAIVNVTHVCPAPDSSCATANTGVELILGSKVQCKFCFEVCTP